MGVDWAAVRNDFPVLRREIDGAPIVYLDSGNTSQKPVQVIEAMDHFVRTGYAPINRSAYRLAGEATDRFEGARSAVARLVNAPHADEIVFTKNATEALNLVASSWGGANLGAGDAIVLTHMEHHANIVPWQMLCEATGVVLKVAPIEDDGSFRIERFAELLTERTKLVAITHCSNVLGTRVPAKEVIRLAHDAGAKVLIDGAQGIVHGPVDVQDLDADFYAWTAHKLYGPSGLGILYGKLDLLNAMPPFLGGGEMIDKVSFAGTTYAQAPHRFEAGTPAIVETIGIKAAIDYITEIGHDAIRAHEQAVLDYATERLGAIDGVRLIGTAEGKAAIVSFLVDGHHPLDIATILDRQGVACRVGHHCAEPLMDRLGVIGTVRASFAMYNTLGEVDVLAEAIEKAKRMLS